MRDKRIYIRVSDAENDTIEDRAAAYGMDKSSFLRLMALQGELKIPSVPQAPEE